MKTLVAIVLSGGVCFGAAYLYVSNQKAEAHRKETAELKAQWDAERDKLEKEVKRARSKPVAFEQINTTNTVEVAVSDRPTAQALIEKLTQMKLSTSRAARYQSVREMIHYLEMLREGGNSSVPAIQQFLALNQDVDYERDREEEERREREQRDAERAQARAAAQGQTAGQPQPGDRNRDPRGGGENRGGENREGRGGEGDNREGRGFDFREMLSRYFEQQRLTPPSDYLYPPTLRLGLMNTLKAIGTPEAQAVLAEILAGTGRGVELAFAARALEDLSPGAYRDAALTSAKDLLLNPLTIPNPSRMDRDSRAYLFGVLQMYNDTSLAGSAQALLFTEDGRLSRSTLNYLTSSMKENALPILYQASHDPRLTNQAERAALLVPSFLYAGNNPTANQMIQEIVASPDMGMLRFAAISMLDGGDMGPINVPTPSNPQDIMARKNLLQMLGNSPNLDERTAVLIKSTERNLQNLLEGKPKESGRSQFGGGDRGGPPQGMNRGGGNFVPNGGGGPPGGRRP